MSALDHIDISLERSILCPAAPRPHPRSGVEDLLFLDFQVFTANSSAPAATWPFDGYAGHVIRAVSRLFHSCYQKHKGNAAVSSVHVESVHYAGRETQSNGFISPWMLSCNINE